VHISTTCVEELNETAFFMDMAKCQYMTIVNSKKIHIICITEQIMS